jgi:hypothetical protein
MSFFSFGWGWLGFEKANARRMSFFSFGGGWLGFEKVFGQRTENGRETKCTCMTLHIGWLKKLSNPHQPLPKEKNDSFWEAAINPNQPNLMAV